MPLTSGEGFTDDSNLLLLLIFFTLSLLLLLLLVVVMVVVGGIDAEFGVSKSNLLALIFRGLLLLVGPPLLC